MENVQLWLNIVIEIMTGLTIIIPLVITLVNYIKKLMQEKKWNELVKITLDYMIEAEKKYSNGTDKKTLVIAMVQKSAEQIGYNFDVESETKISNLIDSFCDAAKIINTKVIEEKKENTNNDTE